MDTKPDIPHADLIRAVLNGKTVQVRRNDTASPAAWVDLEPTGATIVTLINQANCWHYEYRLRPESIESWHPVFSNGFVDQGFATRAEVLAVGLDQKDFKKVLRLELDPDTLDVIDARTEAP